MLQDLVRRSQWDKAVRLCRFVSEPSIWACLAAVAMDARDLNTAETAFAAIDHVDKLQYVRYIKDIPSEEGRAAELAAYRQRPEEAEAILLQVHPDACWSKCLYCPQNSVFEIGDCNRQQTLRNTVGCCVATLKCRRQWIAL